MNTHDSKKQENKSKTVPNRKIAKYVTNEPPTLKFVDNRPEAAVQRKLREIASHNINRKGTKATTQLKSMVKGNGEEALEEEADMKRLKQAPENKPSTSNTGTIASMQKKKHSNNSVKTIQRVLYRSEKSNSTFESEAEVIAFYEGATEKKVTKGALLDAYHAAEDYYVNFRGSTNGGPRSPGYQIDSIEKYAIRPAVDGAGTVRIHTDASAAAGFSISGRPAWDKEVIAALKPTRFRDNIRHIIPWHSIKESFMNMLETLITSFGGDKGKVMFSLMDFAKEVGASTIAPSPDMQKNIISQSVAILAHLNNIPGNLWPGDKIENQRLNSLRTRVSKITSIVSSTDDPPGTLACQMLQTSLEGGGDMVYKGIIKGALDNFPEGAEERKSMSLKHVQDILSLVYASCEVDAMPRMEEFKKLKSDSRSFDEERFLSNFPKHFKIYEAMRTGNNIAALIDLSKLGNPFA